jgi:predicted DNA-binding transcriptional regulator AlpA
MNQPHLSKTDLARRLGVAKRTIDRLRAAGQFPKPITVGHQVRWPVAVIEQWEATGGHRSS